jgi:membrane protein YqaA with SNARE-associated domain
VKRLRRNIVGAFVLLIIFAGIFFLAQEFTESSTIQLLILDFGYVGVVITGVIGGLNTFVPIPAASFTPLFVAAGLYLPLIILMLTIGTLIADYVGFALGHVSREMVKLKQPKIFSFFLNLKEQHHHLVLPAVFLYAAIMPIPNEFVLIPLALSGIPFRFLFLPLLFGNLINQAVLSYGFTSLFDILF